jgi:hypothetical protein
MSVPSQNAASPSSIQDGGISEFMMSMLAGS